MASTPPPTTNPEEPQYRQPGPEKKSNVLLIVAVALIVLLVGCGGIFAAILFPVFAQARQAALKTQVLSNMKQLGTGMAIYLADYNEYFPPDMSSIQTVKGPLDPYLTSLNDGKLVYEPLPGEFATPNPDLAGKRSVEVRIPSQEPMFTFESEKIPDTVFVVYVDTSARAIKKDQWLNGRR